MRGSYRISDPSIHICNQCLRDDFRVSQFLDSNQSYPTIFKFWALPPTESPLPFIRTISTTQDVFQIATQAEKQLISVVTIYLHIFRKVKSRGALHFYHGNMIAFPQLHPALQPVLKLPRSNIPFVTIQAENGISQKHSSYRVRRDVVVAMLSYLKTQSNNPLYTEDVQVDLLSIDAIPQDGEALGTTIQTSDKPLSDKDVLEILTPQSQVDAQPSCNDDDSDGESEGPLRENSSMTLQEPTTLMGHSNTDSLAKLIKSKRQNTEVNVKISELSQPISYWDPTVILGAFPYLFLSLDGLPILEQPAGSVTYKNNVLPKRHTYISFRDQVIHLLRLAVADQNGTLTCPFQIPQFVFFARSVLTFDLVSRNVRYFAKDELKDLTVGELRAMLNQEEGRSKIERFVWKSVATVQGSKSYWDLRRKELWEISKQQEHTNTFFTFSIADNHHPVLLKMLGIPFTSDIYQKTQAISCCPGVVDRFFELMTLRITQNFLKKHFGFSWLWHRVEYQNRGVAHCHGVGDFVPFRFTAELLDFITGHIAESMEKTGNPPLNAPVEIVQSLERLDEIALKGFAEKGIKAHSVIVSKIDAYITACSVTSSDESKVEDLDLITQALADIESAGITGLHEKISQLASRCMIHKCSVQYCKAVQKKCRFGYPQPLLHATRITLSFDSDRTASISIAFRRDDPYLHPICRVFLLIVGANCDFKPILDRNSVLAYILKYVSKREPSEEKILRSVLSLPDVSGPADPGTDRVAKRICSKLERNEGGYSGVSSALTAISSSIAFSRTVSISEAIHHIFGDPLYHCTLKLINIPVSIVGKEINLQLNQQDSNDKPFKKNTWDLYRNRDAEQEEMNANDFFQTRFKGKNQKEPTILLFGMHSSMKTPSETSVQYADWSRWFMIRWIPWRKQPGRYFLELHGNKLSMDASNFDPDDMSNSHSRLFWETLIKHIKVLHQTLFQKVTLGDETIRKLQRKSFAASFGTNPEDRKPDGEDETDDVKSQNGPEFEYEEPELPNLASSHSEALGHSPQGECLRGLYMTEPDTFERLAQICRGGKFWISQKKSKQERSSEPEIALPELHKSQQDAVDLILKPHESKDKIRFVLILGPAGTGKSLIIETVFRQRRNRCLISATTGTAAYLVHGCTISSLLALWKDEIDISDLITKFTDIDILIIDEAGMLSARNIDMINYRLMRIVPEGKTITVAMFGDFSQCPPVGGEAIYKHPSFRTFESFVLTHLYRQNNPEFQHLLREIANGSLSERNAQWLFDQAGEQENPDRIQIFRSESVIQLAGNNEEVELMNLNSLRSMIQNIPETRVIKSPYFRNQTRLDMCQYFAADAPIVLDHNQNVAFGYTNGAEGICGPAIFIAGDKPGQDSPSAILVKCPGRKDVGWLRWLRENHRLLLSEEFDCLSDWVPISPQLVQSADKKKKWICFPMRLCWAKTIHKAQGQSLSRAIIRIPKRDQNNLIYVALSRLRSVEGMILSALPWLNPTSFRTLINKPSKMRSDIENAMKSLQKLPEPSKKLGVNQQDNHQGNQQGNQISDLVAHFTSLVEQYEIESQRDGICLSDIESQGEGLWLHGGDLQNLARESFERLQLQTRQNVGMWAKADPVELGINSLFERDLTQIRETVVVTGMKFVWIVWYGHHFLAVDAWTEGENKFVRIFDPLDSTFYGDRVAKIIKKYFVGFRISLHPLGIQTETPRVHCGIYSVFVLLSILCFGDNEPFHLRTLNQPELNVARWLAKQQPQSLESLSGESEIEILH